VGLNEFLIRFSRFKTPERLSQKIRRQPFVLDLGTLFGIIEKLRNFILLDDDALKENNFECLLKP
jgi:hypothetical protein